MARDPEKARAYKARYRAEHKAEIAEYNHQYWLANAERLGDYNRRKAQAWVHATPERLANQKAKLQEWNAANPEKRLAGARRRRQSDPERYRKQRHAIYEASKEVEFGYARARRARLRGAPGSFTAVEWRAIRAHYGEQCVACGADGKLTVDHIVPLDKGGAHCASNIQPLCKPCNSRKARRVVDYRPCPPPTECFSTKMGLPFGPNINLSLKY